MATKTETPKLEREYIIPLREEWRKVPRYKRANKAVKAIKEFLVKHMKIYDRDLDKIKIDKYLNEFVWFRGIKHPPHKVKVKAVKEGEIVRVELVDLPTKMKFKKLRKDKAEEKAEVGKKKKKELVQTEAKTDEPEKKDEEEKKTAVIEEGKELEKAAAKQVKRQAKAKIKEPKVQTRVVLGN